MLVPYCTKGEQPSWPRGSSGITMAICPSQEYKLNDAYNHEFVQCSWKLGPWSQDLEGLVALQSYLGEFLSAKGFAADWCRVVRNTLLRCGSLIALPKPSDWMPMPSQRIWHWQTSPARWGGGVINFASSSWATSSWATTFHTQSKQHFGETRVQISSLTFHVLQNFTIITDKQLGMCLWGESVDTWILLQVLHFRK